MFGIAKSLMGICLLLCCLGSTKSSLLPVIVSKNISAIDTAELNLNKIFTNYNDPVITTDNPSCIIPFSRAGNLILIQAKADTIQGNFILDTGAPGLVLNLTYFRNYSTTTHNDEDQGSISGTNPVVNRTELPNLSFGSFHYHKVEADMLSLGHIENSKGVKILGLLGMAMFKQCELIIDYEKNLIYLHHIARKESNTYKADMLKDSLAYNTVPINILENKVIVRSEMAGKKLKFVIDCGAETNILDSRLPNKIFEQVTINQRISLAGSGSKKVEALYGEMRNFKIGTNIINNLPVVITNLEKSCFSFGECVDGVLGFDFLSLHKIGFNFVTNKMFIWK